jgi:hypothetical protein
VGDESNSTWLVVGLPELGSADWGLSQITGYGLEIDDGSAGDFTPLGPPSMIVEHSVQVERGLTYRLRYRAQNSVGWGPYSQILRALAAQPPCRPAAPIFVISLGTSIALRWEESPDDGGARISSYELWMSSNYQAAGPVFTQVAGYVDNGMGYTVGTADGAVPGTTYSFRLRALNSKGASEQSEELIIAAAQAVAQPSPPTRVLALTNKTSIHVEWSESVATEIPV